MAAFCAQIEDEITPFALDTPKQPWIFSPYSLISWWDMEQFGAVYYFNLGSALETLQGVYSNPSESLRVNVENRAAGISAFSWLAESLEKLALKTSVKAARQVRDAIEGGDATIHQIAPALKQLQNCIQWEMESVLFFHVPSNQAEFYAQAELFGVEVNTKFPSIQFDMIEAGNCFAMGRGTACVFHLMRIMEVGVQQFGAKLGVTLVNEKNWQNILDEINKAIKALPTKAPGSVEMSQASANLYSVKLAWRNEVMHPNDTYTLEEAENLIRQVRIFMGQLAKIV
jgi:hypothetical protein